MAVKVLVAALGVCCIAQAPAAHAYTDEMLIDAVHLNHAYDDMDDDLIVTAAHAVCNERNNGATDDHVAGELMRDEDVSRFDAMYFVGVAETAYCPEYNQ
jgi:hypothetical protein